MRGYSDSMRPVTENPRDAAANGGAPPMAPSTRAAADSPAATDRRQVMDTLLGENRLAAIDVSGGDPYNATGRLFRR